MSLPKENAISIYGKGMDCENDEKLQHSVAYCNTVKPSRSLYFDEVSKSVFNALGINNHGVLITGEKGVGKSSLVKHIQYMLDTYKCPSTFYNAEIVEMDVFALGEQLKTISEYDVRLGSLFNSIYKSKSDGKEIILYIDNIYNFIFDTNINAMCALHLENAIKKGVKVICCCNTQNKKHLDAKYDLFRHFTTINLKEQSAEHTKEILKSKIDDLNVRYFANINNELIDKVVTLSDKYIKNGFAMPMKAMRVLETIAAKHSNDIHSMDKSTSKKINEVNEKKEELDRLLSDTNSIVDYYALARRNREIDELEAFIHNKAVIVNKDSVAITDDDVYTVISDLAGVPVAKLTESDTSKLKTMEANLEKVVIGQDETIEKVCKTIKRNRIGLRKKDHTIGNFIFLGSTGVGKTFLAKKLSEYMFGSEDTMIRLDMSEYRDEISVNKLIGAPPGYVGYGEGGVLCNAIRNNPYSVILFDEIEKAHPAIFNTILQLLDEGRLTDSNGIKISATNTIIILTSNVGVKEAKNAGNVVGFSSSVEEQTAKNSSNQKAIIDKEMKKVFSPEFLNRIDGVCYFNDLTTENLNDIFDNEMAEVKNSMKELGYAITINKAAKDYVVEKSAKEKMGARALIRILQQDIVDIVTELIINEEIVNNEVKVTYDKKKNELVIK